jgi:hypothetical protein
VSPALAATAPRIDARDEAADVALDATADVLLLDDEVGKSAAGEEGAEGGAAEARVLSRPAPIAAAFAADGAARWQAIPRFLGGGAPSDGPADDAAASAAKEAALQALATVSQSALPKETHLLRITRVDLEYGAPPPPPPPSAGGDGDAAAAEGESGVGKAEAPLATVPPAATPPAPLVLQRRLCTTATYLVHARLGAGRARSMATSPAYRALRLLPWAGVAARLALRVDEEV